MVQYKIIICQHTSLALHKKLEFKDSAVLVADKEPEIWIILYKLYVLQAIYVFYLFYTIIDNND